MFPRLAALSLCLAVGLTACKNESATTGAPAADASPATTAGEKVAA